MRKGARYSERESIDEITLHTIISFDVVYDNLEASMERSWGSLTLTYEPPTRRKRERAPPAGAPGEISKWKKKRPQRRIICAREYNSRGRMPSQLVLVQDCGFIYLDGPAPWIEQAIRKENHCGVGLRGPWHPLMASTQPSTCYIFFKTIAKRKNRRYISFLKLRSSSWRQGLVYNRYFTLKDDNAAPGRKGAMLVMDAQRSSDLAPPDGTVRWIYERGVTRCKCPCRSDDHQMGSGRVSGEEMLC